ncbi:MAG TPA: bifunctional demethylmenaquinone methyltransferase/2-methoxy-6-polyprenyl-1,4-benzoquinol methylase UbiE [Verrucomicrobiae bacterium]
MANKFYEAGEKRAEKVNDLFAAIAPRYDLINDLQSFGMHRLWKRKLIKLAAVKPGGKALDLCCGTGDVAFALAGQGAEVLGVDFSGPMLMVAKERQARDGVKQVEFVRGDALRLPAADASVDVLTISYGLRNLADFEGGLREMLRVLKPGGRLLVLDFGVPDNVLWRWGYFQYLKWFVPVFGRLFCGDSDTHAYILKSLQHYPAQRGVEKLMHKLGCQDVRVVNLLGGVMGINYGVKAS